MTTRVTRAEWGAQPRKAGTTEIIDHPSITFHYDGDGWKYPWDHSTCDDKVRGIQAYHMLPESQGGRGWSDIAYNEVVCPHDFSFEGRGWDRRSSANGNDATNAISFAICALWGTNSEASSKLPDGLKRAYMYARGLYIKNGGATTVIKGHRDWKSTDCPGDQIYAWIQAGCPLPPTGEVDMTTDASVRQIVKEELKIAAAYPEGVLENLVQRYSAFGAENTRQNVDQAQEDIAGVDETVDLVLKDDFAGMNNKLNDLSGQVATLTDLVRQLINTP